MGGGARDGTGSFVGVLFTHLVTFYKYILPLLHGTEPVRPVPNDRD
jgi:hypothetical protein